MDDTEMQDPSTEAEPLPPITLDVFQFVRIAQSQHGLKHYDYARYRSRPSSYLLMRSRGHHPMELTATSASAATQMPGVRHLFMDAGSTVSTSYTGQGGI